MEPAAGEKTGESNEELDQACPNDKPFAVSIVWPEAIHRNAFWIDA
jgi:hypothetical protein